MKLIFSLTVIMLSLQGCRAIDVKSNTYTNEAGLFTFQYPDKFIVKPFKTDKDLKSIIVYSPGLQSAKNNDATPKGAIFIKEMKGALAGYLKERIQGNTKKYGNNIVYDITDTYYDFAIFDNKNNRLFVLSTEKNDANYLIIKEILTTFKILESNTTHEEKHSEQK